MRIFNFLLASDAVGGLGPPEGLVNNFNDSIPVIVFAAAVGATIIAGLIYFYITKDKRGKGDE